MFDYIPEFFKAETADTEDEGDRWYTDKKNNRRPPELLPRDEVARAINAEIKAGRGSPHGGVFLDIASRRSEEFIRRRLPSMYHQFKELADVDITEEPMEIGPTCHYVMGGVEVDPDTAESIVDGLYAAGEVAGGMHGSNRLGGNSLSDLLVFGRRAGLNAAYYAGRTADRSPVVTEEQVKDAASRALAPFEVTVARTPTRSSTTCRRRHAAARRHHPQRRRAQGVARPSSTSCSERAKNLSVEGHRQYNPGWHLAIDIPNMLPVSECIAKAALERKESRGGHTRDDFPAPDATGASRTSSCLSTTRIGSISSSSRCRRCPPTSTCSSSRDAPCFDTDPSDTETGATDGLRPEDARLAWRQDRGRPRRLHRGRRGGRGRPRRDPPAAGDPGRRPRGALELQGRQVRLVQRRDQRQAAAAVHDPAVGLRARARRSR